MTMDREYEQKNLASQACQQLSGVGGFGGAITPYQYKTHIEIQQVENGFLVSYRDPLSLGGIGKNYIAHDMQEVARLITKS